MQVTEGSLRCYLYGSCNWVHALGEFHGAQREGAAGCIFRLNF